MKRFVPQRQCCAMKRNQFGSICRGSQITPSTHLTQQTQTPKKSWRWRTKEASKSQTKGKLKKKATSLESDTVESCYDVESTEQGVRDEDEGGRVLFQYLGHLSTSLWTQPRVLRPRAVLRPSMFHLALKASQGLVFKACALQADQRFPTHRSWRNAVAEDREVGKASAPLDDPVPRDEIVNHIANWNWKSKA